MQFQKHLTLLCGVLLGMSNVRTSEQESKAQLQYEEKSLQAALLRRDMHAPDFVKQFLQNSKGESHAINKNPKEIRWLCSVNATVHVYANRVKIGDVAFFFQKVNCAKSQDCGALCTAVYDICSLKFLQKRLAQKGVADILQQTLKIIEFCRTNNIAVECCNDNASLFVDGERWASLSAHTKRWHEALCPKRKGISEKEFEIRKLSRYMRSMSKKEGEASKSSKEIENRLKHIIALR